MPRYRVLKRVDSYSDYEAFIEAESEGDALDKAEEAHKHGGDIAWEECGVCEFDDATFEIADEENGYGDDAARP